MRNWLICCKKEMKKTSGKEIWRCPVCGQTSIVQSTLPNAPRWDTSGANSAREFIGWDAQKRYYGKWVL